MSPSQHAPNVLAATPAAAVYLAFDVADKGAAETALARLRHELPPDKFAVGLGSPLLRLFGGAVAGLSPFARIAANGIAFPDTQRALWVFAPGADASDCFDRADAVEQLLLGGFVRTERVETFKYRDGRDLTGYIDGTANPEGELAVRAAHVAQGEQLALGVAGGAFALVQRWEHNLSGFRLHTQAERDNTIGRRIVDNAEIPDAPISAHVKRTEMESFDPPVAIVRRSMPWSSGGKSGLYFVAFANSLTPFDKMLRKMVGEGDGVKDALFTFSHPLSGSYYFIPPVKAGAFDLRVLGFHS